MFLRQRIKPASCGVIVDELRLQGVGAAADDQSIYGGAWRAAKQSPNQLPYYSIIHAKKKGIFATYS